MCFFVVSGIILTFSTANLDFIDMRVIPKYYNYIRKSTFLLMLLLAATLTSWAQTTYTVTLKAGDGSGSDITISSADAANVAELCPL